MLRCENASLKLENAELRRRLDLNSENSSKPPSSDGLKKKGERGTTIPQIDSKRL